MGLFSVALAQNFEERFNAFTQEAQNEYESFRDKANKNFSQTLKGQWEKFEVKPAIPKREDLTPVPPRPYNDRDHKGKPVVEVVPLVVPVSPIKVQPGPISPIQEVPHVSDKELKFRFYGLDCKVRIPQMLRTGLRGTESSQVSDAWTTLSSNKALNNTLRDCLDARTNYGLSDWAYLKYLDAVAKAAMPNSNDATLLMAYLFSQSGYQMRLGSSGPGLHMLIGTNHKVIGKPYYNMDGSYFFVYGEFPSSLSISRASFKGETPLSLQLTGEQQLGDQLSEKREIKSKRYPEIVLSSQVPTALIEFFYDYPKSQIDNNYLTEWAMYANTPLNHHTKNAIYPTLKAAIAGGTELDKVNKLLNLVQTGFTYGYDNEIWGEDRPFFAEETLYYPYSDCEDRAILFSRLVRDLVGLDVALVYYPGHLATAVKFNEDVSGDAMLINGQRFVVCDPTYMGAAVGRQMPNVDPSDAEAILLGPIKH